MVTVVHRIDDSTYLIRRPNNSTTEVSTQRLKKYEEFGRDRDQTEALGPWATDYPHMFMEGDSRGQVLEENLHVLDGIVIPPYAKQKHDVNNAESKNQPVPKTVPSRPVASPPIGATPQEVPKRGYKFINAEGKELVPKAMPLHISYEDFVVYATGEDKAWSIGQYLGDHPNVPEEHLRLRKMNVSKTVLTTANPRVAKWGYEWAAEIGDNLVTPFSRNHDYVLKETIRTGRVVPAYVDVAHQRLRCVVKLQSGMVTSATWRRIRPAGLDINKICSIHLIPPLYCM